MLFCAPVSAWYFQIRLAFRYRSRRRIFPGAYGGSLFLAPFLVGILFVPRRAARIPGGRSPPSAAIMLFITGAALPAALRGGFSSSPLAAAAGFAIAIAPRRMRRRVLTGALIVLVTAGVTNLAFDRGPYDELLKVDPRLTLA
jgi:hypothetical protein